MARAKASGGKDEPARQDELLRIAADLFADRGYAATTVRDIADEAGILSGSLYHHFDSKESMVDAILADFIEKTLARYEAVVAAAAGPREAFRGLVEASFAEMDKARSASLIFQNEVGFLSSQPRFSYLRGARRKFERIWTEVLERGIDDGEFRRDIEPKLVYRLAHDAVWAVPRWYRPGGPPGARKIADQYLAVLVDGVVGR